MKRRVRVTRELAKEGELAQEGGRVLEVAGKTFGKGRFACVGEVLARRKQPSFGRENYRRQAAY